MTAAAERLAPPLSPEAYAHCFVTFRKHSTEWLAMLRWCQEHLLPQLPVKSPFATLSVGAGNGDFDWRFIQILQARLRHLEYVVVEPNEDLCRGLRERFSRHPFAGVRFEIDPVTCEDFAIHRPFDLIHFTHCLYYIPERGAAIDHALKAIKDGGLVLIFHQTPLGIDQVQRRFIQRVKGSDEEMFTSQDIQAILDRRRIPLPPGGSGESHQHLRLLQARLRGGGGSHQLFPGVRYPAPGPCSQARGGGLSIRIILSSPGSPAPPLPGGHLRPAAPVSLALLSRGLSSL